jgi:peptide/nickel transport system permease protein
VLGTDQLGRDVPSRLIYGARACLVIAFGTSALGGAIGAAIGILGGHLGGWVDATAMRLANAEIAFPFLVIAIAATSLMGATLLNLVLVRAIWGWAQFAKVARAEGRVIEAREYIPAAGALGASGSRIMLDHVLPNLLPVSLVVWTFSLAIMLPAESSLSFLGFGVQPSTPSWGGRLEDGRAPISAAWWPRRSRA